MNSQFVKWNIKKNLVLDATAFPWLLYGGDENIEKLPWPRNRSKEPIFRSSLKLYSLFDEQKNVKH